MILRTFFILVFLYFVHGSVFSHGGENHGHDVVYANNSEHFVTLEKSSHLYEVLIKYKDIKPGENTDMLLYVSNFRTNKPIDSLSFNIYFSGDKNQHVDVKKLSAGIYNLSTVFKKSQTYQLNIMLNGSLGADMITIDGIDVHDPIILNRYDYWYYLITAISAILFFITGFFLARKFSGTKKFLTVSVLFSFLLYICRVDDLVAHGGSHGVSGQLSGGFIAEKETQFLFGITTEISVKSQLHPSVSVTGSVTMAAEGMQNVNSPFNAVVKKSYVKMGQEVRKGEPLLTLSQITDMASDLSLSAERNNLMAEYRAAEKDYQRLTDLNHIASQKEVDEARARYERTMMNLNLMNNNSYSYTIYSPISGVVSNYYFTSGSILTQGERILSVINPRHLLVEAQVPKMHIDFFSENAAFNIEEDTGIHLNLIQQPATFNKSNQYAFYLFEPDTHTDLIPGQLVNVRATQYIPEYHLVVPNAALTVMNGRTAVFVKNSSEKFSLRYVTTSYTDGSNTVVSSGISEGERVVINGVYELKMIYMNQ